MIFVSVRVATVPFACVKSTTFIPSRRPTFDIRLSVVKELCVCVCLGEEREVREVREVRGSGMGYY